MKIPARSSCPRTYFLWKRPFGQIRRRLRPSWTDDATDADERVADTRKDRVRDIRGGFPRQLQTGGVYHEDISRSTRSDMCGLQHLHFIPSRMVTIQRVNHRYLSPRTTHRRQGSSIRRRHGTSGRELLQTKRSRRTVPRRSSTQHTGTRKVYLVGEKESADTWALSDHPSHPRGVWTHAIADFA